jgi:intraflagellar transport protein 27
MICNECAPSMCIKTVGVEFCVKQVPIPDTNIIVELYIFDCAGQSMFNQLGMNAKYYEDASAVMVIYDVSNHDSLKSCGKWLEGVKAARKGSQGQSMSQPVQTPIIGALVGNKKDYRPEGMGPDSAAFPMRDSRAEVSREEAQRIGADLGLAFFETSALFLSNQVQISHVITFADFQMNNDGVEEPFKCKNTSYRHMKRFLC